MKKSQSVVGLMEITRIYQSLSKRNQKVLLGKAMLMYEVEQNLKRDSKLEERE